MSRGSECYIAALRALRIVHMAKLEKITRGGVEVPEDERVVEAIDRELDRIGDAIRQGPPGGQHG